MKIKKRLTIARAWRIARNSRLSGQAAEVGTGYPPKKEPELSAYEETKRHIRAYHDGLEKHIDEDDDE